MSRSIKKLLVANRSEIAIRCFRAATELGLRTVAVYSYEDRFSLHRYKADEAFLIGSPEGGQPVKSYLDSQAILDVAIENEVDAIHPGYGFLSERADLARACNDRGIIFVGPTPEQLDMFGDKMAAKRLAIEAGVATVPGSKSPVTGLSAAEKVAGEIGYPIILKASFGGGGRGMRVVSSADEIAESYKRARSEAGSSFGNDAVFVERLIERARHIEVQVIGDPDGNVSQLGERECTVQRRHQKLLEIAPSPALSPGLRAQITGAAVRLAQAAGYYSLGTFEFLVDADSNEDFVFIEANARLQVEHTVTEEVTGVDLVQAQIQIAGRETLAKLNLEQSSIPAARGYAIQARVNLERMMEDGSVRPAGGTLSVFDPPAGPGVRVDTFGYTGYATNPRYDSLLAKVIAHSSSDDYAKSVTRARRALEELREGINGITKIAHLGL